VPTSSILNAMLGAQLFSKTADGNNHINRLTRSLELLLPATVADTSLAYFRSRSRSNGVMAERLHENKAAWSSTRRWWCSAMQRYGGTVDKLTGDGMMAMIGGRPRSALALARPGELCGCRMSLSTLGPSRLWALELLLAIGNLFRGWRMPTAVALAGLILALTWVAIGVHVHGWVTAFDAPTASWIENSVQRSHGLDEASLITERLGNPVTVAAAALIGGALLAWRARSLRPGVVVIGTVGGAVLARNAIGAIIYRPPTEAEIQALPLLSTEHHPFPSGHVAGIGALLGIIAVCIAVGRSRIVQALATALVGAGVVIVAFSRLYLDHHWLSDVIGGALLAAVFVILGTVTLTTRSDQSVRARSAPGPAAVFTSTTS
jgi:membrane-associated phospholipid phosphatase